MDAPDTGASSSQDTAAMDAQLLDAPTRPNTPTMDASSSQDTAASSLSASRATVGVKRGRPDPAQPEAVEAEVCTICLSALVDGQSDGEAIRTLRCGHRFHEGCIEEWLPRQALCPCCRQPVRPPCRVIIRGIELEVAFADESEPCLVLISRACAAFADRYPVFTFRFPLPTTLRASSVRVRVGGDPSAEPVPLPGGCAATSIAKLVTLDPARRLPALLLVEPRHPRSPPHGFSYARTLLPLPPLRVWHGPRGTDAYYARRPGWAEAAVEEHENGRCGWSRRRRVVELEAELSQQHDDDATADAVWEPRRRAHVFLRQALLAYCAGEVGPKALFDEGEGPLQGPVGTTHVSLPACREHEEAAIEAEARAELPLCLYGCPFQLEFHGAIHFLCHLLVESGVVQRPTREPQGGAFELLRPHIQMAHLKHPDMPAIAGVAEQSTFRASCRHKMLSALADGARRSWEPFRSRPLPLILLSVSGAGMLLLINPEAPAVAGKLPHLELDERVIELPGVEACIHAFGEGDEVAPPSLAE